MSTEINSSQEFFLLSLFAGYKIFLKSINHFIELKKWCLFTKTFLNVCHL